MNGFEKHGLDHTSASQINMYADAPCAWAAKYLFNGAFVFGSAARAGILVEDAVVNVVTGSDAEKETEVAIAKYNKACGIMATKAEVNRGEAIKGMIEGALEELKPYGEPEFDGDLIKGRKQKSIKINCKGDGWELPVIGYLDFHFPKEGLIVDLKTTMRMPSVMSAEHLRQGSIYKGASGNQAVKFLYVTGKKTKWFDIEDEKPVLAEIKSILNRQEKMLRLEKDVIKEIMPVNASSYYWTDSEILRQDLYGI